MATMKEIDDQLVAHDSVVSAEHYRAVGRHAVLDTARLLTTTRVFDVIVARDESHFAAFRDLMDLFLWAYASLGEASRSIDRIRRLCRPDTTLFEKSLSEMTSWDQSLLAPDHEVMLPMWDGEFNVTAGDLYSRRMRLVIP